MSVECSVLLAVLCLAAGYAFGNFQAADIVARCLAGVSIRRVGNGRPDSSNVSRSLGRPAGLAVIAGDVLKTALTCWFCYKLAAPELGYDAMLYGGLGALLGQVCPLWLRGKGGDTTAVLCTWLTLYLPITGGLCVLAGAVVAAGTGKRSLAAVLIPCLAVPVAWLQFGMYSGLLVLLGAVVELCTQTSRKKEGGPQKKSGEK